MRTVNISFAVIASSLVAFAAVAQNTSAPAQVAATPKTEVAKQMSKAPDAKMQSGSSVTSNKVNGGSASNDVKTDVAKIDSSKKPIKTAKSGTRKTGQAKTTTAMTKDAAPVKVAVKTTETTKAK
jgi:hypothetical protein